MGVTEDAVVVGFHGSISRRLTVLSVFFFIVVAFAGGISVHKAHHIGTLHAESEELDGHIQALDRLENAVLHLRAETQDALFLGEGIEDPNLKEMAQQIWDQWERFEQMHFKGGRPWSVGSPAEMALYHELEGNLEHFLGFTKSIFAERPREGSAQRRAAAALHAEAHRLEEGLQRLGVLHHALIAERTRAANAEMDFILWTYKAFMALGGLAVAVAGVLFVRRMAIPLRRLNEAALDVARGGFERRVPVTSRDEIGMLAHTFNRMAEALSERDAQVRRRAQEAEALHRIGTEISSLLQIERVITSVVESARGLLGADAAGLALANGPAQEIRWTVFVGGREGALKEVRLRPREGVAGRVVATGNLVMVEDAENEIDREGAHPILTAEGLRAALAVPLRRGDRTLGALMVADHAPRRFTDEEAILLSSFANQVAVAMENAELYGQVQALHRVGMEVSSLLSLDRILQTVVESARAMLRTDVAAICLLQDGGPHPGVVAMAGPWDAVMGPQPATCCDDPAAGRPDLCQCCHETRPDSAVGHLSAPLKRGDQVLGALCVGSATPRAFGAAERDLLGGLAAQAAIAIENARLYEAVRGMGAVEERERLAREMHDGLAQALGFLNLRLALAERSLDGGPAEPARQALAEMRKVAGDAYDEVRQAIFGLRTMVSRGLGLIPTLSEYLHEFSQQSGIEVKLEAPDGTDFVRFAPEVEVQLIRIVQEALNNVRKHAGARGARVGLRREGNEVVVAIEDDGAGFDPTASPADGRRHFGLATMRERAESVGGALGVRSAAGTGTQVLVRLPLAAARRGGVG
jgi:nitrate/nitrite-specific signal transduction histidine kinase